LASILFIVINEREDLGSILRALRESGAGGATVIETTGLGRSMARSLPLFGGLRHLDEGVRTHNHTLFVVIRSEDVLKRCQEAVLEQMNYFLEEGSGMMITVPVSGVWGGCDDGAEESCQ